MEIRLRGWEGGAEWGGRAWGGEGSDKEREAEGSTRFGRVLSPRRRRRLRLRRCSESLRLAGPEALRFAGSEPLRFAGSSCALHGASVVISHCFTSLIILHNFTSLFGVMI